MELNQNQSLRQSQSQTMALSQAQYQSLQVLAATTQELQAQITTLLQTNPVVELRGMGNEIQIGDPLQDGFTDSQDREDFIAGEIERDENARDYLQGDIASSDAPLDYSDALQNTPEAEKKRQFMLDSQVTEASPRDDLLYQLGEKVPADSELYRACEVILGNLNENGFLKNRLYKKDGDGESFDEIDMNDEEIAMLASVSVETASQAVELVQTLEPAGIGARNVQECLLIQLKRKGLENSLAGKIVEEHWDDLLHNRIPVIAKALKCSVSGVNDAIEDIRSLDPYPGRRLFVTEAAVIIPEAYVTREAGGAWRVKMNRDSYPDIVIAPAYMELSESPQISKEERRYLREKVREGEQFIKAIQDRCSTIEKITASLVELQTDFFDQGPKALKPMTMAEIAEMVGVHETTVSRAIAGKYISTPWGLFAYRYFFTVGYQKSDDGEEVSSRAVRQKIRELIDEERPDKPLSDQKLSELLAENGMEVARRTVAKYREMEGIPTASLRKIHV